MRRAHKNVYAQSRVRNEGVEGEVTYQDELGYSGTTSLFGCSVTQLVRNSHEYQVKEQLESGWNPFLPLSISVRCTFRR
jgi:hypothetical protein